MLQTNAQRIMIRLDPATIAACRAWLRQRADDLYLDEKLQRARGMHSFADHLEDRALTLSRTADALTIETLEAMNAVSQSSDET